MLDTIIKFVTWPYVTAVNFVDARPSAAMIKTHLERHVPTVQKEPNGALVSLVLKDTDMAAADPLTLAADSDIPLASTHAWADGVVQGYKLATDQVNKLTRGSFREDSQLIAESQAAKERPATGAEGAAPVAA